MKKTFRKFLFLITFLFGLLLILVFSLNVFYMVLTKKQANPVTRNKIPASGKVFKAAASDTIRKDNTLNLIPVPQKVTFNGGHYNLPGLFVFTVEDSLKEEVSNYLKIQFPDRQAEAKGLWNLRFIQNKSVPAQGYKLKISSTGMSIEYNTKSGIWYALVTMKVLDRNYSGSIPCVEIEDSPDLDVRGVMLDISRDKVPKKETLFAIAEMLSDLKFNHFELYTEGFSFAYPSFKNLWEGKETPVTGEEIEELDAFCRDHLIDLVPNQNSLGHMMQWLATDEYKDLAECPKGYKLMGLIDMKGTLDPNDPGSLELVTKMTDDLLPCFSSGSFNVNLDEPFELGLGKNKELAGKTGVGRIYLDYALKMHRLSTDRGRKMLMWGDIVLKHPDLIPLIPKDITLLDWGYEATYPYGRNCRKLEEAGLPYMVCPGTNSWTTITGRTDNMLATIASAAKNGAGHGAQGLLITDWGDMGHWQYLPVSYAGYTAGAALSWNSKSENEMPLAEFLSTYIFRDKKGIMGDLVLDLGRYCQFEEFLMLNMTTTMMAFQLGLRDKNLIDAINDKMINGLSELMKGIAPEVLDGFMEQYMNRHGYDYAGLEDFLLSKEKLLAETRISTSDSSLIKDEYANAIRLIRLGSGLKRYIEFSDTLSTSEKKSQLKALREFGTSYLDENLRLWLSRNKPGGYERSTAPLHNLMNQIEKEILSLEKPTATRWIGRLAKRAGTMVAVLFLKRAWSAAPQKCPDLSGRVPYLAVMNERNERYKRQIYN